MKITNQVNIIISAQIQIYNKQSTKRWEQFVRSNIDELLEQLLTGSLACFQSKNYVFIFIYDRRL